MHLFERLVLRGPLGAFRRAGGKTALGQMQLPPVEPTLYLTLWFVANVAITLCSKILFEDLRFPYPMLLTAIHLGCTALMAWAAMFLRTYDATLALRDLSLAQLSNCAYFSFVFTCNIWLSNYGLMVASIKVHQVIRTTIPLFTMFISLVVFKERYPISLLPCVLVVIGGVVLTIYGDLELTTFGVIIALLGCAFSSMKGILTRNVQLGMHTLDVLRIVCPMSVLQLMLTAAVSGELGSALAAERSRALPSQLLTQGALAALLNFVSFKCAALHSPLTMNIAGNIKQVLTPIMSWMMLGTQIGLVTVAGLVVTLGGAVWYGSETARFRAAAAAARVATAGGVKEQQPV